MGIGSRKAMAPKLTPLQYDLIYNMASLGLASMMASTAFFFLRLPSFGERYKAALCFTGLVTFIAMYHYFRIFESFNAAYTPCEVVDGEVNWSRCDAEAFGYSATGIPFNDAYRYVDWLLTVPLLLIEIVLVMRLSEAETFDRCCKLGVFSALMIANGYPGEISADSSTRWIFWLLSMCPFVYIVYTLFVGLKASQDSQPSAVRNQVRWACWATVFSWCTYPIVFVMPMMMGSEGGQAGLSASSMVAIQCGYTFSDIISKCGVGYLVYRIGLAKSMNEDLDNVLDGMMEDSSEYQVVTVLETTKPKPSTKVEKAQPKPKPEVPKPKPKAAEKPQMKPLPKKASPARRLRPSLSTTSIRSITAATISLMESTMVLTGGPPGTRLPRIALNPLTPLMPSLSSTARSRAMTAVRKRSVPPRMLLPSPHQWEPQLPRRPPPPCPHPAMNSAPTARTNSSSSAQNRRQRRRRP